MTTWNNDELDRISTADELRITTARRDGSVRAWVPIWVVRAGDEVYVRSYRGADGAWYRYASRDGAARIRVAGVEREVDVHATDETTRSAIDEAYRAKYARYGATYLRPMLAAGAVAATIRLTPRD